jgi:hypothetical protein
MVDWAVEAPGIPSKIYQNSAETTQTGHPRKPPKKSIKNLHQIPIKINRKYTFKNLSKTHKSY